MRSTLAATGQATERDIKAASLIFSPSSACIYEPDVHVGRHETLAALEGDALHLEGEGRQGSWEKRRRNQHGVWGASVGEVACSDPISRCRLSKPSDSCRLPGYGYGHLKSLFTQQERLETHKVDAGRGTWPQPLNLGSTGCIYIRPDRMFPLHGSLGGSLISADCRLHSTTKSLVAMRLSFSLLLFPRP